MDSDDDNIADYLLIPVSAALMIAIVIFGIEGLIKLWLHYFQW